MDDFLSWSWFCPGITIPVHFFAIPAFIHQSCNANGGCYACTGQKSHRPPECHTQVYPGNGNCFVKTVDGSKGPVDFPLPCVLSSNQPEPSQPFPTHLHLPSLSKRGAAKPPRPHFGRSGVGTPMAAMQPPSAAPSQKGALREGAWQAGMFKAGRGPQKLDDFRWLTLRIHKAIPSSSTTQRMSRLHAWSLGVIEPLIRMTPGTHFLEQRIRHIKPLSLLQGHLTKSESDSAWSSGAVDSGLDPAWLYVGKGVPEI